MLGKTVLVSGKGYIRVSLTDDEVEKHMDELLKFNIREMHRVITETKNSTIVAIPQSEAVKLLFEKQGMACFTFLQTKVDEKIDKLKKTDAE